MTAVAVPVLAVTGLAALVVPALAVVVPLVLVLAERSTPLQLVAAKQAPASLLPPQKTGTAL